MPRVIFVSGKGGVGKTTVAAATALAAAERGYRTLVLSLDIAHSLSDSFDLDRSLFDQNKGQPSRVAENLELQEIDVHEDIARHWSEVFRYVADIFAATGLDDVVAEEVAIIPGTEDLIALMYINQYIANNRYDVIVLDAPPTGESLRFVSIYSTLQWYMRKRFNLDRTLVKLAGPLVSRLVDAPLPDDKTFLEVRKLFKQIEGVDLLLRDPKVTSVRLVTAAEKMVIRESQRAYLYFNLYGMTTDLVIVNRLMPASNGYFSRWAGTQARYVDEIREYFDPVPIATVPMFPDEVLGPDRLMNVAQALYRDDDPTRAYIATRPYQFTRNGVGYTLQLRIPFVKTEELDISRLGTTLVLRVGGFKQQILLPRAVQSLKTAGAEIEKGELAIHFGPG